SGLPGSPQLIRTDTVPSLIKAIAVSDDGAALAVAADSSLTILDGNAQQQFPLSTGLRDIRFRSGSHDVIYVDTESVMGVCSVMSAVFALPYIRASRLALFGGILVGLMTPTTLRA